MTAAIDAHLPDRRGIVLECFSEPKACAIGREAYPVRGARKGNQLPRSAAIRVGQVDVRSFCKGELLAVSLPDGGVSNNIREGSGVASRQGKRPELRFVFGTGEISG